MKKVLIYVLIFAVIIAIAGIAFFIQEKFYNDGVCPNCNVSYETKNIIINGNEKMVVSCPNCPRFGYVHPTVTLLD